MLPEAFTPPPSRLRVEPILRFQRYRDLSKVAPAIREVAEEMVRTAEKLSAPSVVFLSREIDRIEPEALVIKEGPTFHGRFFAAHLREASELVCFVATLGPALDDRVTELAEGDDLLEALFLDTAGWLAIENALRALRKHLGATIRARGLRLSPRLGPGFMDWSLTEQQEFFSLFEGTSLPVLLSEHSVMTPKKSVSGLFGLAPGA